MIVLSWETMRICNVSLAWACDLKYFQSCETVELGQRWLKVGRFNLRTVSQVTHTTLLCKFVVCKLTFTHDLTVYLIHSFKDVVHVILSKWYWETCILILYVTLQTVPKFVKVQRHRCVLNWTLSHFCKVTRYKTSLQIKIKWRCLYILLFLSSE